MNEKTRTEVIKKLELNGISDPCDSRIEGIAMDFPEEYDSDDTFVEFQSDIGDIVDGMQL
jgi:hypothetical protein